jgi:proteasome lid subunit RPN8/RPN11
MEIFQIPSMHYQEMIHHVQKYLPEEACGLLAGKDGLVQKVIPVTNAAHSPTRFYMDPVELLHALTWIDESVWELIGIFHSHPKGPAAPSETDIKEFLYPGTVTVILSPSPSGWAVNAFDLQPERYEKIQLLINRNDD